MNLDGDYFPVVGLNISLKNECQLAKGVKKKAKETGGKALYKKLRAQCVGINKEMRACKAVKGEGCNLSDERQSAKEDCATQRYAPWGEYPICSWT